MGNLWVKRKPWQAAVNATVLSVMLALVAGCGGDSGGGTSAPVTPATGMVSGQVVSLSNSAPVSGATVKTDTGTTTTAADGKFSISAPAGDRTLVRVEATGFADAFPIARVTSGQTTNLGIKLVPIAATETVSVAAGGTVSVPNSTARLVIPANSLVPAGGAPAGTVTVSLTPINPAIDPNLMPGGFNGVSAGGGTVQPIESFGLLLIDIRDSAGTRYNLAQGKTALIRIPLGTQSANPPPTMPLWYFDETAGVWQEEGTAVLQGTGSNRYYEGTMARVAYWNADLVLESIVVSGCVRDANGQLVSNALVQTEGVDYTGVAQDITRADGTFSVAMRKSSRANLRVVDYDPQTFALVSLSNIVKVGPSATNINLPNCLVKQPGPLAITTTALPGGTVGVSYNQTLAASGGVPGYVWSLNAGSNPLPTGLTLNPAGVISGTPTTDGTKTITIKVTDSTGAATTKEFALAITGPTVPSLTITTTTLPTGIVGTAYNSTLAATGGTGTKSWSISTGILPAGLSLNTATGIISGTPTAAGSTILTVRVQDSGTPQQSAERPLSISILLSGDPPVPPSPRGQLTVSNAPPRVGGTFVAASAVGIGLSGDSFVVVWGESSGTFLDREVLSLRIDPSSSIQSKRIEFATVIPGSLFTETSWTCKESTGSEGPQCEGLTINRATGTATFSDVILNSNAAPPITLSGTLTFTPF